MVVSRPFDVRLLPADALETAVTLSPLGYHAFLALSVLIVACAGFIIDNWFPYLCAIVCAYSGGGLALLIIAQRRGSREDA